MTGRKRFLRVAGLILLALPIVVLLQQSLNAYFAGSTVNAISLRQTSDGLIDLPQSWQVQFGKIETRVYHFEIDLPNPIDARQAIYFPAFEQRLQVVINGQELKDSSLSDSWYGPLSLATALVKLPEAMLRRGINTIDVSVEAGPLLSAGLAPFLIGDYAELNYVGKLREFLGSDLAEMLLGIHFLLILIVFIALSQHPREHGFKWILLALIPSTLFSLGVLADYIPRILELTPLLFTLSVVTPAALFGFTYAIEDTRPPSWLAPLLVVYLITVTPIVWYFPEVTRQLVFIFVLPLFLLFLLAALYRTIHLSASLGGVGYHFIAFGIALVLLCTVRDWSVRTGLLTDGVFLWTSPVRSIVLIGITIVLLARMGSRSEADRISNLSISARLKEQEVELEQLHTRREKSRQREAIYQERQRILKDLHDGVAGQLAVISTLASKAEMDGDAIRSVCKSALVDLRTVVNTLSIKETDLIHILGVFRDKYLSQLDSTGVKIKWDLLHSPDVFGFSSEDALNLIRILQEAMNNALKHSELSLISVSLELVDDPDSERLVTKLSFDSEGSGEFRPGALGLGLRNIAERAEQFGASVDFVPCPQGLRVELDINVKRSAEDGRLWLDRESYEVGFDL